MSTASELPIIPFESQEAWRQWLDANHASPTGIWLQFAKKDSGIASVSYVEAVQVALCYGWIDGQAKSYDAEHWLQRFTPRRPKSIWSKVNRDRAMALMAEGKMQAAGLREVERAKADGRWERAYDGQKNATVPEDLQREFDRNRAAAEFFASLDSTNRFAVLFRIQTAGTPALRAARIEKLITMLAEKKAIHR